MKFHKRYAYQLKQHEMRHTNKKIFECTICLHRFKVESCLNNHISRVHPIIKKHHCKECDKKFSTPY